MAPGSPEPQSPRPEGAGRGRAGLLGSAALISGFTLLSRITGLVRETLTAALFGASALTDAFFVAFRLPNLLRRMFAEGAFSQAFVPMLASVREAGGEAGAHAFVDRVATVLFWALVLVSALGVLGAPALVWLVASGLPAEASEAAVVMTRWMFPYILLISLVALSAGILNTWRHFAVPAFTPVLLNLAFIGAALFLAPHIDPPIHALAAGVVLGGVAQLAIQIPALRRIRMLPRFGLWSGLRAALADPEVRRVGVLMGPALLAVSVAQVSLLINTHIASRLGPGSVSWISFGDRLMEFPTALLGVALGTVLLPSLSKAHASGRQDDYSALLDWGLRLTAMLALPCLVGMAFLATPLTALLFHYGRFDAHDLAMTAQAVLAYAVGLPALVAIKILAPGFYAQQDVRTPFRIALVVLVCTQLLNLVLVPVFAHAGLALAISLAACLNAGLLLAGLLRRGIYRPATGWGRTGLRIAGALSGLALGLAVLEPRFDWVSLQAEPVLRIGLVLGLVGGGGILYLGLLFALGARPGDFRLRFRAESRGIQPNTINTR